MDIGFVSLLGYAAAAPFSILVSQACLVIGALALIVSIRRAGRAVEAAGAGWLLVGAGGYAAATLASAAFSLSPVESLADCKSLVLLLLPVAAIVFLDSHSRWWTFLLTIGASTVVAAVYGLYQYRFTLGAAGVSTRAHGFFSIWTTYGQFMMVAGTFALGALVSPGSARRRLIAAVVCLSATAAMGVSFVRGAWVGMSAAAIGLLGIRKPLRLLAIPVIALYVAFLAPPEIFSRMVSIFSLRDQSNRDRIDMLASGLRIIADHPVLGIGPNMISRVYMIYRMPGSFPRINPHLHNNVVQIAAERGLIALAFWCLMFASYFKRAWTASCSGSPGVDAAAVRASLAAIASFLIAGLFDFNFGDSEVVMPALILLAVPFVLACGRYGGGVERRRSDRG